MGFRTHDSVLIGGSPVPAAELLRRRPRGRCFLFSCQLGRTFKQVFTLLAAFSFFFYLKLRCVDSSLGSHLCRSDVAKRCSMETLWAWSIVFHSKEKQLCFFLFSRRKRVCATLNMINKEAQQTGNVLFRLPVKTGSPSGTEITVTVFLISLVSVPLID